MVKQALIITYMFLLLWNWLFKVCHLHTEDRSSQHGLLETPIYFILPTTTHPLHPGAQRSVRKGGGEDGGGDGKQSRAEPCLTPEEKKGTREGTEEEWRETEGQRKYLKTASREAQKQGEWETGVTEDVVEI